MGLNSEKQHSVGVLGATGRLGGLITQEATAAGLKTVPLSSRVKLSGSSDLADLDVLIIASPSRNSDVHRLALEAGCHVIDVGIDENVIRSALELDQAAKNKKRRIILMAGLAPGISGLLALDAADRFPCAETITVVLVQSSQGAAGKQGVSDMLDMLTNPSQPRLTEIKGLEAVFPELHPKGFSWPSPERFFLGDQTAGPTISYLTLFDAEWMNRGVNYLRILRQRSQSLYQFARNFVSSLKAKQPAPSTEEVYLLAIATGKKGEVLGHEELCFASDYGATAKTACALALSALSGEPQFGAGHPSAFYDLAILKELAAFSESKVKST
jgi:hypothetical protein